MAIAHDVLLLARPETMIDGEVVAMDPGGRPSISLLQNYGSAGVQLLYLVSDVVILRGRDVMHEALSVRGELLQGPAAEMGRVRALCAAIRCGPEDDDPFGQGARLRGRDRQAR